MYSKIEPLKKFARKLKDSLGDNPSEFVLPRLYKRTNINSKLGDIIERAGLPVWPKRWQNLRATRATELERHFSSHVVTKWCGHTERIAKQHYWMTTDEDYDRAASHGGGAYSVQQSVVSGGNGPKAKTTGRKKSPEKPGFANPCEALQFDWMEDNGLEQSASDCSDTAISVESVPLVSQSLENSVRWNDLRGLIAGCVDLPKVCRDRLIAIGDGQLHDE